MNEAAVNKLGIAPAKPMLTKIDAIKTPADLQNMFRQLHDVSVFVPFVVTSMPDNHNPTQVIASIFAGGLGLPDRDYYLKTEPRFQDARRKYLVHDASMIKLADYDDCIDKAATCTRYFSR